MESKSENKIQYELSNSCIDDIAERIEQLADIYKLDKQYVLRLRLSVEESLNIWLTKLGSGKKVIFELGRKMMHPFVRISVEGEHCNPYDDANDDFGSSKSILVSTGVLPYYEYAKTVNVLFFYLKRKKINPLLLLTLVIATALITGILGTVLFDESITTRLCDNLFVPVENAMFNIISCIAGPLIFLSVAQGIYGIGDVYTLGRVGRKMLFHFIAVMAVFCLGGLVFYPFLGLKITQTSDAFSQFGVLFEMVLGIFPSNIVSPFADGNTLQIIFLAFVVGTAMIYLGQRTKNIAVAIVQINNIISFIMKIVSDMVPLFVWIVFVQLIWSGKLSSFISIWKLSVAFIIAYFIALVIYLFYTGIKNKTHPYILFKHCLPSYLIALTTASSSATFESSMSICKKKLGIDDSLSSFGIPFGMVTFRPTTGLYYMLLCFYFAYAYDVNISISWLITAVVVALVSAVATPPIPGGSTVAYTALFLQLGIPEEALFVAVSVDMVFDFLLTSGDMFALLLAIFNISNKLGMRKKRPDELIVHKAH